MSKFYFRVETVAIIIIVKPGTLCDGNKNLTKFETKCTAIIIDELANLNF